MKHLLTILLTLALSSLCASAATIRVPADQPTIQAGIEAASDGDTVLLADGTYTGEGNRDIGFLGKAITLRSENGPETCIIDAEGSAAEPHYGFYMHEEESRRTIIEGLTITGGYPSGIEVTGTWQHYAHPTIRNCIVRGNATGMVLKVNGHPLVESTRVFDNTGPGIYSWCYTHIVNSEIRDNMDGGLYLKGGERVENCLISGNSTEGYGGGVYCDNYCRATFINCTIVNNTAVAGGGLAVTFGGEPELVNCILSGNSAQSGGDQYAVLDTYYYSDSILTISYSDVAGEVYVDPGSEVFEGPGMIDEDPLFVTGPRGDFYLSQTAAGQGADSPCVDTGDPETEMILGTTRTDSAQDSGIVDMGYHYAIPTDGHPPETVILSGPDWQEWTTVPVVVFTFSGTDQNHPASALTWSWRHNGGPWSAWSPRTLAAISELEGSLHEFEVRARNPEGTIDPLPADRLFLHDTDDFIDPFRHLVVGPGPGPGNPPLVRTSRNIWTAYSVMRYGVNLAAGNIDGDGPDEVITGPGPGEMFGPHVRCFSGDGTVIHNAGFLAYGTHKYGVKVAAGDVDGDGYDEIITGAGPGAVFGPHVRGWNWDGGPASTAMPGISFFAYGTLKWGVNVACGDIDGDGRDEIVTGAGPGAVFGPHVRGWNHDNGQTLPMGSVSFFAFSTRRWGVNVACGDIDGDGIDEIITGAGPHPAHASHVRAWKYDGSTVAQVPDASFFAFDGMYHGAVVSAADVDEDGLDEILTMPGPGSSNIAGIRAWKVVNGHVGLAGPYAGPFDYIALDEWLTHGGNVAGSKNGWE